MGKFSPSGHPLFRGSRILRSDSSKKGRGASSLPVSAGAYACFFCTLLASCARWGRPRHCQHAVDRVGQMTGVGATPLPATTLPTTNYLSFCFTDSSSLWNFRDSPGGVS